MDDSETGYSSNVEVLPASKKSLVVILLATPYSLGDQQHITDVSEDISSVFRI
jgi:hypothetical protein